MLSKLSKLSEEYNVTPISLTTHLHLHFSRLQFSFPIKYSVRTRYSQQAVSQTNLFVLSEYVADPGATMTFVAGGALKPIGGHILSHASATRMFLRKGLSMHLYTNDLHYSI